MKKIVIGLIAAFFTISVFAQTGYPLTIADFIKRQGITNFTLGPNQRLNSYEIEGYVQKVFWCPPCPPGAQCEPCGDYFIIGDSPQCQNEENGRCAGSIIVHMDHSNNYKTITPGTIIRISIETSMSSNTKQYITPEQTKENEKYRSMLKESLDNNPNLRKAKRPEWLKDIPGETYEFKK